MIDKFKVVIEEWDWDKEVEIKSMAHIVGLFKRAEKYQGFLVQLGVKYCMEKNEDKKRMLLQAIAVYSALGYIVFVDPKKKEFVFKNKKDVLVFLEKVLEKIEAIKNEATKD